MAIKYKNLVKLYESAPAQSETLLREAIKGGEINPREFDFGRWFEECFGWEEFRACRSDRSRLVTEHVYEAAGAVSTAAFQKISGQIVYGLTLEGYESEEFVFTKLIPEYQSDYSFEKVAGLTDIGPGNDSEWVTPEGEPFQYAGFGQDWIHLPETTKRGKIVPVTREAIFFDRTSQIQEKARMIGYALGQNTEIRAIDCVIDENAGAKSAAMGGHRYHWQDTSIATYGDNSGTHNWDNLVASNGLVDWTDLDAADQVLNEIVDPFTGMPVVLNAIHLICTKQREKAALRILNSTQLHTITPGYATTGNPTLHDQPNPYAGKFEVITSRLLAQRMATDTTWYYGDLSAFVRVINFPFKTESAPSNSEAEFNRDIVLQERADVRDAFGTKNPRKMVKCTE